VARSDGLTCKELVELVTEYLEGTMSPADRSRFEEHLAICPGCITYVEQMRQTIALVGQLTEDLLPAEAERDLLQAFRAWKSQRGKNEQ